MKKTILKTTLFCAMLLPIASVASQNVSVGGQLAIYGVGANAKYKINDQFGVRAGFDMFALNDYEIEQDEATFKFDVKLQDFMAVADWHPWGGSFKTSAGLIVNNSNLDGDIIPNIQGNTIEFTFNGTDYSYQTDELGSINVLAEFDPVAPYIGIGWDTSFDKKSGFGFTFDFGLAFQGAMQTDYSLRFGEALDIEKETEGMADGPAKDLIIANINSKRDQIKNELEAELDKEMVTLQDELDKYKIMPYISIGFNYKF